MAPSQVEMLGRAVIVNSLTMVIVNLSSFPDWLGDESFAHLWEGQMAVVSALS